MCLYPPPRILFSLQPFFFLKICLSGTASGMFLNNLHSSFCCLSDESLCRLSTLKRTKCEFSKQFLFQAHRAGMTCSECCKIQISGLLHLETTYIRCALLEKRLHTAATDFPGVDLGCFFARTTFSFVQFALASWLANSGEYVSLQSEVNLGSDTHTWNTSQSSRWIKTHSEIKPRQQNSSPCKYTQKKTTRWAGLYCTVLYCTVLYCVHGFQQRCIKHRFGAIRLLNELIIHDHLESRAMNITDDTHEAIYQSAGNRWTRLEERCTVHRHCFLCCEINHFIGVQQSCRCDLFMARY